MDGVFMKKLLRRIGICFLASVLFWCGTLFSDRQQLREQLIRLHVVANSDSAEDQDLKLRIRDVITENLRTEMANVADVQQAKKYLEEKLPYIQKLAENTLRAVGCEDLVQVSLCEEAFNTRQYNTFSLPAGIYQALRITVGEGAGNNWWCVVFPSLCIPETQEEVRQTAAETGLPDSLNHALTGEYEIRFACLDALGKLENIFFSG